MLVLLTCNGQLEALTIVHNRRESYTFAVYTLNRSQLLCPLLGAVQQRTVLERLRQCRQFQYSVRMDRDVLPLVDQPPTIA